MLKQLVVSFMLLRLGPQERQQVGIDLLLMCDDEAMRCARIVDFLPKIAWIVVYIIKHTYATMLCRIITFMYIILLLIFRYMYIVGKHAVHPTIRMILPSSHK